MHNQNKGYIFAEEKLKTKIMKKLLFYIILFTGCYITGSYFSELYTSESFTIGWISSLITFGVIQYFDLKVLEKVRKLINKNN